MDNAKYLRVLKIAQIPMEVASVICSALSEETLNRITKVGFDRRYIYPVIELAAVMLSLIHICIFCQGCGKAWQEIRCSTSDCR